MALHSMMVLMTMMRSQFVVPVLFHAISCVFITAIFFISVFGDDTDDDFHDVISAQHEINHLRNEVKRLETELGRWHLHSSSDQVCQSSCNFNFTWLQVKVSI